LETRHQPISKVETVMARASPIKSDLVIGMTLAEIFLLILFVVWYSQGAGKGPDWKDIAEQRQKEIANLKAEVERQKQDVMKLKAIQKWWEDNYGVGDVPASNEQLRTALDTPQGKKFIEEMKRGFPRCEEDNVLVAVFERDGATEVRIEQPVKEVQTWAGSAGMKIPAAGDVLRNRDAIESFLQSVGRFYENKRLATKPCRFDYKLTYKTAEDYKDGRETFEKYFYPAGIKAFQ
jgi:hypothetical protein